MLQLVDVRYRCTGCGDCCRGWDVPLVDGEAAQFLALAAPLVPAARLRGAIGRARQGDRTVETLVGRGGQCVALADDQRCLIHGAHGADAKPRACRIFPFTFVATPTGVRVGLSFACPAVDVEGPALGEQRAEIDALFASAVDGTRYLLRVGERAAIAPDREIAWADAARLIDGMIAALQAGHGPLVERLCGAGALCALVLLRLEEGQPFEAALAAAAAGRDALVAEALAQPPAVDRLSRALFRTLLKATEPGRRTRLGQLGGVVASLMGTGGVKLGAPGTPTVEIAWREVAAVAMGVGADGERLLTRWLGTTLSALTFFGDAAFGLSIASGLDLLTMSAAVAVFLARARAAAARRTAVTFDDLRAALRQLDAGLTHRSDMPASFGRALDAAASLDLLREQLGG